MIIEPLLPESAPAEPPQSPITALVVRSPIPPATQSEFAGLPEGLRREVLALVELFESIGPPGSRRVNLRSALRGFASEHRGWALQTLRRKYYEFHKARDWRVLVDRVRAKKRDLQKLAPEFIEFWRSLCEENKRCDAAAYRVLLIIWRTQQHPTHKEYYRSIPGYTSWPVVGETGEHPAGWSYGNLQKYSPKGYAKLVARVGRSAAGAQLPLVYRTRAELWVGSHFVLDDLSHDHFVNVLDTGKCGRPLEFGVLDLFSACKVSWGMRVRTIADVSGKMEGLKEGMMRYLLAKHLWEHGYSERGTVIVAEHGTAAVRGDPLRRPITDHLREDLEKLLYDASGGLITVSRSGFDRGGDAMGLFVGDGHGNSRFKAHLESNHNLAHNEMGALPGQTGLSVERRPECLQGQLNLNASLLAALAWLEEELPEVARLLELEFLEFGQFLRLAIEIYHRMNSRTKHDLEGWQNNIAKVVRGDRWRFRRMSPNEVWLPGRKALKRFAPAGVAMLLGPDLGFARQIRGPLTEVQNKEIAVDALLFDTHEIDPGEYQLVVNPFMPDHLFVYDCDGGFLKVCPRKGRISLADTESLHEEHRKVKRVEATMLAGPRARGAAIVRRRIAAARNNAALLADAQGKAAGNAADRQDACPTLQRVSVEDFQNLSEPVSNQSAVVSDQDDELPAPDDAARPNVGAVLQKLMDEL